MISLISKLPPVSIAAPFPCFATNSRRDSEAAFRISAARTESSFLLVWALITSVSAKVVICAGVKCRRLRGEIRYSNDRRPWVDFQIVGAAAVNSEMRDLATSFVSLGVVMSVWGIFAARCRQNGLLDYIEGREKNQLSKLLLAHAFHVRLDCLYDLFSVLADNEWREC